MNSGIKISGIKIIRIALFSLFMLMFGGNIIVKYIENVKSRSFFFMIVIFLDVILTVLFLKSHKSAKRRIIILDLINIVLVVGLFTDFAIRLSISNQWQDAFEGNNGTYGVYARGIGGKGYEDIEDAIDAELTSKEQTLNLNETEEIYRIHTGNRNFVYFKTPGSIIEYEFFSQDNVYYSSGHRTLVYYGLGSSEGYTTEETIRKDIANTMNRGLYYEEVGAPIWGVSDDERVFSMTIDSEKPDDFILVEQKAGKKYYFWIMTHFEGIKTIDDVQSLQIEIYSSK